MRPITHIIIHCSATALDQNITAKTIDHWHRKQGYKSIGYHYVILPDGTIEQGRDEVTTGAHCKGHNQTSIGICYIGGLDTNGKSKDTRTPQQKEALRQLVADTCSRHPITDIGGHRDYSPDRNKNGIIETHEWIKACPCFEVKAEFPVAG
jgi:N-acetyl-anhydromuramyl-L-alanine amidase AmpD